MCPHVSYEASNYDYVFERSDTICGQSWIILC